MAARSRPLDVLVLYMHLTALPMRPTMASHLRFLEQGRERHRVVYLNTAGRVPPWIRGQRWDLVVLHYSVLAARWTPRFARIRSSLGWLAGSDAAKAAGPVSGGSTGQGVTRTREMELRKERRSRPRWTAHDRSTGERLSCAPAAPGDGSRTAVDG